MVHQSTTADGNLKVLLDLLDEQGGVPEALFLQFLVEKLLNWRGDQRALSRWRSVGQTSNPTLDETGQVVVNRLMVATKMFRQPGNGPTLPV